MNAHNRGVEVRIVADLRQSQGMHSIAAQLKAMGIPLKVRSGIGRGIMHHKFAVIDSRSVLTGSYNWTTNAEKYSYENAVLIEDVEVVKQFAAEFERLWGED